MDEPQLTPEVIAQAAQMPAEGAVDGRSAKAVPIPDQIAAAKFAAANARDAQGRRPKPFRLTRAIPPGAS